MLSKDTLIKTCFSQKKASIFYTLLSKLKGLVIVKHKKVNNSNMKKINYKILLYNKIINFR